MSKNQKSSVDMANNHLTSIKDHLNQQGYYSVAPLRAGSSGNEAVGKKPKKALLVIDMQIGSFSPYPYLNRHNTLGIINNINALSEHFNKQEDLVIFTQEDNSEFENNEFDLLPELTRHSADIYLLKKVNEAFYQTKLDEILKHYQVSELYLCGIATDYCIDATLKSALSKDYNVHVASDAHTASSNPFFEAEQLIAYYNWIWERLSPTRYPITVLSTEEIIVNK